MTSAASSRDAGRYIPIWLVFGVLACALLASHGLVATLYVHDLYVVFDGMWRVFEGQQVFRDFHSPVGIGYFVPAMILRTFEPYTLVTLLHATVMVGGALLLLCALSLRARLSPALFFVAVLAIVTTAMSPRITDGLSILEFSNLAPYNRWCEAAVMTAIPLLFLPVERSGPSPARIDWIGAVTIALLALFVFNVKVTFFLCIVALTAVALLLGRISWRSVGVAAIVFLSLSVALELSFHYHGAYLADLAMARDATLEYYGRMNVRNRRGGLAMIVLYSGLSLLLLRLAFGPLDRKLVGRWWRLGIIVFSALCIAAATNLQNHNQIEIPAMWTILVVVAETIRRASPPAADGTRHLRWSKVVLLIGAAFFPVLDAGAIVSHTLVSRSEDVCPIPSLRGTVGEQLLFSRAVLGAPGAPATGRCADLQLDPKTYDVERDPAITYRDRRYNRYEVGRLVDAGDLLKGRARGNASVISLDFANPYPALLGLRAPVGPLLWWDYGRTYAKDHKPDGDRLFGDTNFVLQSVHDSPNENQGDQTWYVYGADVEKGFRPVADGRIWRLWERKRD